MAATMSSTLVFLLVTCFGHLTVVTARSNSIYVINLDSAPEDRWKEVAVDFKQTIRETNKEISKLIPSELVPFADKFADEFERYLPEKFVKELTSIANIVEIDPGALVIMNLIYDLSVHCTSIVAQDEAGNIWHARNMDYDFTDWLQNSTLAVDFRKSNKTVFRGVTFAGYVGLLTGERPGAFSITVDEKDAGDPIWYNAFVALFDNKTSVMSFALRDVLEEKQSFQDAVEVLASINIPAPVYFIMGGAHPGEGAILTRERTHLIDIWLLDPFHDRWFILETNYDHWKPPPSSDDRRDPANKMMRALGPSGISSASLFKVLTTPPVFNDGTVYTTIMSASQPTIFSNHVWNSTSSSRHR